MAGWRETGGETSDERWSRDMEHGEVRPQLGTPTTKHVWDEDTQTYIDIPMD